MRSELSNLGVSEDCQPFYTLLYHGLHHRVQTAHYEIVLYTIETYKSTSQHLPSDVSSPRIRRCCIPFALILVFFIAAVPRPCSVRTSGSTSLEFVLRKEGKTISTCITGFAGRRMGKCASSLGSRILLDAAVHPGGRQWISSHPDRQLGDQGTGKR